MADDEKYKKLREQYRSYKIELVSAGINVKAEAREQALQEVPKMEKQLLEFCLSNGHDLQELQQFYRDVDYEAAMSAAHYGPG